MARQPEEVIELRRAVGEALAAHLDVSPLNQGDLARETNYHRTSISHIVAGRQFPEREFWEKADEAVSANGALVAQYDNACDREGRLRTSEIERAQIERRARISQISQGPQQHRQEVALRQPPPTQIYADSAPIDSDYVEGIHKEIKSFVHLDQQYGGAAASPVILQAYRQIRHRVGTSEIRNGLRRDVYSAISEVAEVAGWSLYDAANDAMTERLNNESLGLARMAGDRNMELFVLQNMSMHAETTGRSRESVNISQLVLETDRLSPRLEALFRLRLARSYGRLGAESESRAQLENAANLFQEGVRDDDPHWSWWINEAQLSWFEGAIRVDLGRNIESVEYFERAANMIPEPRMNYIYRAYELLGYCLNSSWSNVEKSLRGLVGDVGIFGSRRADMKLIDALDLIDNGHAPSTVRDLASAVRTKMANAA